MNDQSGRFENNKLFNYLLELSGWNPEEHGEIPGVFMNRPLGGMALWSVYWIFHGNPGRATPDQLKPLFDMEPVEMGFEVFDICVLQRSRNPELATRAMLVKERLLSDDYPAWKAEIEARDVVSAHRKNPGEYVFSPYPPAPEGWNALRNLTPSAIRPGWGDKETILQRSKQQTPLGL